MSSDHHFDGPLIPKLGTFKGVFLRNSAALELLVPCGGGGRRWGGGGLYTRIKSRSSTSAFIQSEGQLGAGEHREGKRADSGHQAPAGQMSLAHGTPLGQAHLLRPPGVREPRVGTGKGRRPGESRCPASGEGMRVTLAEHPGSTGLCGKGARPSSSQRVKGIGPSQDEETKAWGANRLPTSFQQRGGEGHRVLV